MNSFMKAFVLAIIVVGAPLALAAKEAREEAQWFVLRGEQSSDCWAAKLITIGGQYARGSAQIAGGPYATEAEAEARIADLTLSGTCRGK